MRIEQCKYMFKNIKKSTPENTKLNVEFCEKYWKDRGSCSNNIDHRSEFWKMLHYGCVLGENDFIDFLFRNPDININNKKNVCHLNLLTSIFFSKDEDAILRFLDHPHLDINRPILSGCKNYIQCVKSEKHPLVRAASLKLDKVFDKILSLPTLDINRLSRKIHPTSTQSEIHSNCWDEADVCFGQFSILDQMINDSNFSYIQKVLERSDLVITEDSRCYSLAAAWGRLDLLEALHTLKPLSYEKIKDLFPYAMKYHGVDSIDFIFKHLTKEDIQECFKMLEYSESYGYMLNNMTSSRERDVRFYKKLFDSFSEEAHTNILQNELERNEEVFCTIYLERYPKLPFPLELGNRVYSRHSERYNSPMKYTPLLNLHHCIHYSMYRMGQYCMDELFSDFKDSWRIEKLLWKHYKEIIARRVGFDRQDYEHPVLMRKKAEERQIEKQLVIQLNTRLKQQYMKYISSLSEITLFTNLPFLYTDIKREIMKYVMPKPKCLQKRHVQHPNWLHYGLLSEADDTPFYDDMIKIDSFAVTIHS